MAPELVGRAYEPYAWAHVRRLLLPKTRYHVYYQHVPGSEIVSILSIWGAVRGRAPRRPRRLHLRPRDRRGYRAPDDQGSPDRTAVVDPAAVPCGPSVGWPLYRDPQRGSGGIWDLLAQLAPEAIRQQNPFRIRCRGEGNFRLPPSAQRSIAGPCPPSVSMALCGDAGSWQRAQAPAPREQAHRSLSCLRSRTRSR